MTKPKTNNNLIRILGLSAALAFTGILSACAPVVVGSAVATTTTVIVDRRTVGEQMDDKAIEIKVSSNVRSILPDNARVNNISYAGLVVLTGDVPNESIRQQASEIAQNVDRVNRVINEIRIGDETPLSVRTNDTWITSKVKTALINADQVPFRTILVTTERGNVYLLGRVTKNEADRAAHVVSTIDGVNRVIKAFEIVSEASIATETKNTANTKVEDSNQDVQAMPIN